MDMQSIENLIEGLNKYQGGVLIVSHDQYFINRVCKEIWYIEDKKVKRFRGDFEQYKNEILHK
jgi:ATPase subunit of ABC transporter with duplicated ATPase domains